MARALHKQHIGEATRATAVNRVAFLGDSITEGWWRSGFSGRVPSVAQPQCASIWKAHFGRWSPLNLAIGGDRAQDLGWRLQHGLLPPNLQPKVFFVMIGTNDLGSGEEHEVVSSEVQLVLEQLHARGRTRPSYCTGCCRVAVTRAYRTRRHSTDRAGGLLRTIITTSRYEGSTRSSRALRAATRSGSSISIARISSYRAPMTSRAARARATSRLSSCTIYCI